MDLVTRMVSSYFCEIEDYKNRHNQMAEEVPMDLDGICHVQRAINASTIAQGSLTSSIRSMRSTRLLAVTHFVAIVPVRLCGRPSIRAYM